MTDLEKLETAIDYLGEERDLLKEELFGKTEQLDRAKEALREIAHPDSHNNSYVEQVEWLAECLESKTGIAKQVLAEIEGSDDPAE